MSYFNEIYNDPELNARAKQVLVYLHDRANKDGESWYAIGTMAKDLSLSRSTIKRALAELIRQGRVEKQARFRESGGITSNCYRIKVGFQGFINQKQQSILRVHPLRPPCTVCSG